MANVDDTYIKEELVRGFEKESNSEKEKRLNLSIESAFHKITSDSLDQKLEWKMLDILGYQIIGFSKRLRIFCAAIRANSSRQILLVKTASCFHLLPNFLHHFFQLHALACVSK